MFIGHYGPAIWDAHRANGVRLWHGFLAVQAIDLVFCVLALFGLEGGELPGGVPLAFNIPYSHSLMGAILISLGVAFSYRYLRPAAGLKGALIMGALAFSHWPLDWLVHRPDLSIMPGGPANLGLGLWDYAWPSYWFEVALLVGALVWWLRVTRGPRWTILATLAVALVLCALQFIAITAPTLAVQADRYDPAALSSPAVGAVQALLVFVLTIAAIAAIERKRSISPQI